MNLEKNFSENNFAICFQFSLGIRGELTTFEKELSALKKYETNYIQKGTKISKLFDPLDADFFGYQKSCEYMIFLRITVKYAIIIHNAVRCWNKPWRHDRINQMLCRPAEHFCF